MKTYMPQEQRRLQILESSVEVFSRQGLKATTSKQLAHAAGISEGLLFKLFPTKEELYHEIQKNCCEPVEEAAQAVAAAFPADSLHAIRVCYFLVRTVLVGSTWHPDSHVQIQRLLGHSLMEDGKFFTEYAKVHVEPWVPYVLTLLRKAHAAGFILGEFAEAEMRRRFQLAYLNAFISLLSFPYMNEVGQVKSHIPANTVAEIARFALRGIGFTETALAKHFNAEKFNAEIHAHFSAVPEQEVGKFKSRRKKQVEVNT